MTDSEREVAPNGLAGAIGIDRFEFTEEGARATLPVTARILQPYGIVHGGAYSTLAETVCSAATDRAVSGDGNSAMGQSIHVTFMRPISRGRLDAEARARHRGRTSWVWEVEVTDDEGRLCAVATLVIAVRPRPSR